MIKKFKIYKESIEKQDIKIGYFVIMNTANSFLRDFLENNLGEIIYVEGTNIRVKYNNIPKQFCEYFNLPNFDKHSYYYGEKVTGIRQFDISQIEKISEFKEDLEVYIYANKYNL